jgi:NADPH2:quinone reductase
MRAVGLFTHGGPEVLQVVELPEVNAGPGQVRIRVHAATVNPTDVGVRNGTRAEQQKTDPPPYVPGMEAAGIVDEVGSGVPDRLKVGDAVMAIVVPKGSHGAYREQIVLDGRSVVRAPTGKTHPEAWQASVENRYASGLRAIQNGGPRCPVWVTTAPPVRVVSGRSLSRAKRTR